MRWTEFLLCSLMLAASLMLSAAHISPVLAGDSPSQRILWNKTIAGAYWDRLENRYTDVLYDIAVTPEGDLAAVGTVQTDAKWRGISPDFNHKIWVVRLDAQGNTLWDRTLETREPEDLGTAIAGLPDGGVITAGHDLSGAGIWVMRLDRDGEPLWRGTYGGQSSHVWDIAAMLNGDILAVGAGGSKGPYNDDAFVLRLDPDGHVVWQATFDWEDSDSARQIRVLADGGLLMSGFASNRIGHPTQFRVVQRLDAKGRALWQRRLQSWREPSGEIALLADGGFAACDFVHERSSLKDDLLLHRFNADGNQSWERRIELWSGPPKRRDSNHWVDSCIGLADGHIAVSVYRHFENAKDHVKVKEIWLARLDSEGRKLWFRPISGHEGEPIRAVSLGLTPAPNGGMAIFGLNATERQAAGWQHNVWIGMVPPE